MGFGFERYDLTQITRRIELPEVSPDPSKPITLLVRAANTSNAAFRNELFKLPRPDVPPAAGTASADAPSVALAVAAPAPAAPAPSDADAIAADAALVAGAVLVGWNNVVEDGKPIAFTPEAGRRFIIELRTYLPDVWRERVLPVLHEEPAAWRRTVDPVDLGKG
jgi:hypothetical protein